MRERTRRSLWMCAVALCGSLAGGCVAPRTTSGLNAWLVGGDRSLTRGSEPATETDVYSQARGEARLIAAINETVALQLALRTAAPPAGPYDVRLSDLTSAGAQLSASRSARLYHVGHVRLDRFPSWYSQQTHSPAEPRLVPDVLIPWDAPRGGGPLRLDDARTEIVWIDLTVPPTTEPGEYRARLQVVLAETGTVAFECNVSLTVVPVVIPAERSLPIVARVDPRTLLSEQMGWPSVAAEETRIVPGTPTHQAAQRLVEATMRDLHDNRLDPIYAAGFPKYRVTGPRSIDMDWNAYDALARQWIDGSAYADRVPPRVWPAPLSADYPDAERNGGFASPRYARLLAAYLADCGKHFEQRGWHDRAVIRLSEPSPLAQRGVDRASRVAGIVRQSEVRMPLVEHLPPSSLGVFGWFDAPKIELPDVDVWAPPAACFDPESMREQRGLGKGTWFIPDRPPYSGSLAVGLRPIDTVVLGWQAFRYRADGMWIEHAAERGPSGATPDERADVGDPLILPGSPYGLVDRPVETIRLKRLRRAQLDFELLKMLERAGKPLLAQRTAEQVVRWAFADAFADNVISVRETGWPADSGALTLARRLIRQELVNTYVPSEAGESSQRSNLTDWSRVMTDTARVDAAIDGVRLGSDPAAMRATVFTAVENRTDNAIRGTWRFPSLPFGWRTTSDAAPVTIAPNARGTSQIQIALETLAFNANGIYPFAAQFDAGDGGVQSAIARLAVAAAPFAESPPRIDGDLSDWIMAANNSASDFRLVRGVRAAAGESDVPTNATRAYFCIDRDQLYVAVRCQLREGDKPLWEADNRVPIDGAVPWGQDVVELLLSPMNAAAGTPRDLYTLQIKPSGAVVATNGARTDPPTSPAEPWVSRATVAVRVSSDAWVVEVALPLSSLGDAAMRNSIWGLNVTRLDSARGEYSSWSGARDHCYAPQRLGNLILLRP